MQRVFAVFDTETTGLKFADSPPGEPASLRQHGDEVCQIGGILLDEHMEPFQLFCHYCDTVKVECDAGASAVSGLYMRDIRQHVLGQYLPQVLTEKLSEFFYADTSFIGYNVEFDMKMVQQTIANSDLSFDWEPLRGSIIPRHGRFSIDVSNYYTRRGTNGKTYRMKLSSLSSQLEEARQDFFRQYGHMDIQTNCSELFIPSWNKQHSAFFDALNTFLLWRDTVWQKKLL